MFIEYKVFSLHFVFWKDKMRACVHAMGYTQSNRSVVRTLFYAVDAVASFFAFRSATAALMASSASIEQ